MNASLGRNLTSRCASAMSTRAGRAHAIPPIPGRGARHIGDYGVDFAFEGDAHNVTETGLPVGPPSIVSPN